MIYEFQIQILYIHETKSVNYKKYVESVYFVLYDLLKILMKIIQNMCMEIYRELILTTNFYNNRKTLRENPYIYMYII